MDGDRTKNEDNIMYCDKENVNILTALLIAHGVTDVVVCPGSRNAPLVHNFNECKEITCHNITDERTAGFIALGIRQQACRPVAVCVTSGSALLNVLPAVAEASYQQQGIIVISADRPTAWIGQLDGQTLPQQGALGEFAAISVSLPEPHNDVERWHCNRLVNEALIKAFMPSAPSVHINVPISEPLFSFNVEHLPSERTVRRMAWTNEAARQTILHAVERAERRMVVLGQCSRNDIPKHVVRTLQEKAMVVYEPIATDGMEALHIDDIIDIIGSDQRSLPDCVVFAGGNTVSKRLRHFLRSLPPETLHITVSADGMLHDVSQHTTMLIDGMPAEVVATLAAALSQQHSLQTFFRPLQKACSAFYAGYTPGYSQMLAVKRMEEITDRGRDSVYYANSMAVRLAAIFANHYVYCNRGINGIEGSMSVAVGGATYRAMRGEEGKVYCVIGDLSFFYDSNALWHDSLPDNLRILLLNNGEGVIFRNLKGLEGSPARNVFVAGKHKASAKGLCLQNRVRYLSASDTESLEEGIRLLRDASSPTLLEVFTTAEDDSKEYQKCCSEAKEWIRRNFLYNI